MNTKVNRALGGPAAAEEARTREEVRRRLDTTREQARRRHDQTLHRLARLLRANEPRKPGLTVLAGHGMGLATAMLAGTVVVA